MEGNELKKIKETIEELLQKMTITVFNVEVRASILQNNTEIDAKLYKNEADKRDFITIDVVVEEPQILIGQNGQMLFELQYILRIILNKKLSQARGGSSTTLPLGQKYFHLELDINDYKKKKIEYLKNLAKDLANEVLLTKEKKILPPMPAYERRVIHTELALRQDVVTESQGEGVLRCVAIRPVSSH